MNSVSDELTRSHRYSLYYKAAQWRLPWPAIHQVNEHMPGAVDPCCEMFATGPTRALIDGVCKYFNAGVIK